MLGCVAQGWSKVTNAEPGQRALHAVDKPGAFLDQALALPIGPLGVLFGKRWHAHHAAMAPFAPKPTKEPPLEQFGVEPIGLGPAMFPRHGHTRGMDHVRLDATRRKPARQPETVAAGFESQRNPRNIAAGFDRLISPAMQQGKQPFGARLQLLARLTLNAGKHTANQPTRLAQFDDGNDRAILVQGDEGPAQVVRLGHRGTPSVRLQRRSCHVLAARPIESSSTRAREVGCRAPTAAKSNDSTKPLSMRIGDLRSARTPHQGQEGKDIVVLDRWAEERTEDAVSSLARPRPVSVL